MAITIAFLVTAVAAAVFIYWPLDQAGQPVEFVIEKDDGSWPVAGRLADDGLIRSRWLFVFYTVLVGKEKEFKAGRYLISPAMNMPKIVKIFSEGKAQPEGVLVTIPEGANTGEIVELLKREGFKSLNVSEFIGNEGYLFPDSYWFNGDETNGEIVQKMRENFTEKAEGLRFKNLSETVIIASILEKEVRTEEDRRLVAGVIQRRLELGMPLQIDATVAYGVCRQEWERGTKELTTSQVVSGVCDVTQVNLVDNIPRDSEYNTYRRSGLPPAPIANPGLAALRAALDPLPSDFLYYLSARDGTTIFSRTAAEHAANRRKYLGK